MAAIGSPGAASVAPTGASGTLAQASNAQAQPPSSAGPALPAAADAALAGAGGIAASMSVLRQLNLHPRPGEQSLSGAVDFLARAMSHPRVDESVRAPLKELHDQLLNAWQSMMQTMGSI